MRRYITRACVGVAAGVALSTIAATGASASGTAPRVSSAGASQAAVSPGTQLWATRYNGPTGSTNRASSVAVSPTGTEVFVTGESTWNGGLTNAYATVAYNTATGAQMWVKSYKGPSINTVNYATSVDVSPDGKTVFVTGQGSDSTTAYATIAYNAATGAQLWLQHGPAKTETAYSMAVSPDGTTVYVTGQDQGLDYATVAYNAATGAQLWVKRYGLVNGFSQANSVTVSPTGKTVYVTGESADATLSYDYATVAYNAATGAQLWVKRYPGGGTNLHAGANSVAVSPTGTTVYVTGASQVGAGNHTSYGTVAYNAATGAQLWATLYTGNGFINNIANTVAASPTGKTVYVSGTTANNDYGTIAYNAATGAQLWAKLYTFPGNGNSAHWMALSPDGNEVYVTGTSAAGAGDPSDYGTVAYNAATGAQVWAKHYNGPTNNGGDGNSVAVSPTSRTVFVTGDSFGTSGNFDYATIAYSG